MNNTPSSNEMNKAANMNPNLLTRHYKLKFMNDFMYIKYQNPKKKQSQIADHLSFSSSTIQRYRNDMNMLSPYRIKSNNTNKPTKRLKILILTTIHTTKPTLKDLKRPQMTSKDLNRHQMKIVRKQKQKTF